MGVYSITRALCWPTYPWADVNTPVPLRAYDGKCWVVENRTRNGHEANVYVCIAGVQRPDGRVERHIIVDELGARDPLTAAEARQLARALIAAADDVDRLAGGE